MIKKCTVCGVEKTLDNFYTRDGTIDGFRNNCKQCHSRNTKENTIKYHQENLKKGTSVKEKFCPDCKVVKPYFEFSNNSFRKDNLHDYCKICDRRGAGRRRNKLGSKYKSYMQAAALRGLNFDLSEEIFSVLLKGDCCYCGSPCPESRFNGIDRVDNDCGYTISNSVSCCIICNNMKKTSTKKNFLEHVEKIYKYGKNL
jgi:hypothetical protein